MAKSVDHKVEQIITGLERKGYPIVGVIDHAAAAASVGLELRPTKVIMYDRPKLDPVLLRINPLIGLDLPHKIAVWENAAGRVQVKKNSLCYITRRARAKFGSEKNGMVGIESMQPVTDTTEKLVAVLKNAGFRIPFTLFHPAKRPMSLIIFGNPDVGSPLMQGNQEVSIDLPQKYLVYWTRNHEVRIVWNDPFYVARRGNVVGQVGRLTAIAVALENIAKQGAEV